MTRLAALLTGLALCLGPVASGVFAEPAPAVPPAQGGQAPATPAPAAPAAPAATKMVAVVKTVEGTVETRPAADQPWVPVKIGMPLAEGADVRTGFRARCVIDMTESLLQVDPLTVIRIGALHKEGDKTVTRILMKQGNTQASVVKRPTANDFAIVTPSATFSARGTDGILCRYFPDVGGEYSLIGSGLMQLVSDYLFQQTGVRPGDSSNDNAAPPDQVLAFQYISALFVVTAYDFDELWAAMRWNTSSPIPGGLNGISGPQPLGSMQRGQETLPPSGGSTNRDGSTGEGDGGSGYNPNYPPPLP